MIPAGQYKLMNGMKVYIKEDKKPMVIAGGTESYLMLTVDEDKEVIVPEHQINFEESYTYSTGFSAEPTATGTDTTGAHPKPLKKKKKKKKYHEKVSLMKRGKAE